MTMKVGKRFFKRFFKTPTKTVAASKVEVEPLKSVTQSKSLGGGFLDEDGLVQILPTLEFDNDEIGEGIRFIKRLETSSTAHTDSSSDSASIRSESGASFFLSESDEPIFSSWSDCDDKILLQGLEEAIALEKHVLAARYLEEMDRRGLKLADQERQEKLQASCKLIQETIDSHSADAIATGWTKKGLMHGKHRDTMVYHRTNDKGEVTVRCETPIQASVVAPLVAIVNETDLYTTWLPSFQRPFKLGVTDTGKLLQCSLASQVAYAKVDMPWPLSNREVVVKKMISEAVDEAGALIIRAKSLQVGEAMDGLTIPPCQPGWERVGLDGGLLIQKCPENHPCLKRRHNKKRNSDDEEPMLLATMTVHVTPSFNYILPIITGPIWSALITFADDVQHGTKGAVQRQRMEDKPDIYGWLDETVKRMVNKCS